MIQLQARNISHHFDRRHLFGGLHFELQQGETISLLGPSGCGKSTLLRILAGLLEPSTGQIHTAPTATPSSILFQESRLLPWRTVRENILLPFELGPLRETKAPSRAEILDLLLRLGLPARTENLYEYELSGGMKMRVALARALATRPSLLFLDEPFSALDEQTRFQLQDELLKIKEFFPLLSIILVTHSISEAVFLSHQITALDWNGHLAATWTRPSDLPFASSIRNEDLYFHQVRDLSVRFSETTAWTRDDQRTVL